MTIHSQKLTVARDEDFVVFLIGARINRWWLMPFSWAFALAMPRMLRELTQDPDSGLLHFETFFGRNTMVVQYWRSVDDLLRYAHRKDRSHRPAWKRWAQEWGLSGVMGIWHETYVIEPGRYECFYEQMPAYGLGKVGPLVPASGGLRTARQRLAAGAARTYSPSVAYSM